MGSNRTLRRTVAAAAVLAAGLGLAAARAQAEEATRLVDYQAIAQTVAGRVGQTVEVELGVRNGGPAARETGGRAGRDPGAYEVTAPEGTTITALATPAGGGHPCTAKAGPAGGPSYVCAIGDDFPAGDRETLRFHVRIDKKVEGAEGRVEIIDHDGNPPRDPDPENDSAPIRVEVVDPDPASPASPASTVDAATSKTLLLATTSGTAFSAGVIALGVVRRRR
ncbi:hypothetical protein ACH4U6_34075 [Streptomyces netropsis]|uniref:hypothetical protein n=1 Tax=Streptomyces netropsis TaxID=55404 RepID=UPI0037BB5AF2